MNSEGIKYWGYGGDYEKSTDHNDGDFCCNGIVFPDGTPKPAMFTCKYVYQPIEFSLVDSLSLCISLRNRNFHKTTEIIAIRGKSRTKVVSCRKVIFVCLYLHPGILPKFTFQRKK